MSSLHTLCIILFFLLKYIIHPLIVSSSNHFYALHIHSAPFYKILVPTVDTLRYDFLVHHLIMVERPVLLVGPVGTGKTSVAQGVLQKLDPQQFNLLTINLSAQVGILCRDAPT